MNDKLTRRQLIASALASGGLASLATPAGGQAGRSTLFREVSLVDGTGTPPRLANVLVTGDRIERVTAPSRERVPSANRVVEGGGRVLTPGFIDLHTHGDPLRSPYDGFLAMGVTSITLGLGGSGPGVSQELGTVS